MVCMMAVFPVFAALSADRQTARKEGGLQNFPVEDNVHIYKGSQVVVNTSGYALPGADTQGYRFAGVAMESCDNTLTGHTQGGKYCRVYTEGVFLLAATSITQAMVGRKMFLKDDETFDESSTYFLEVGTLHEYVSTTSGWVDIGKRNPLIGYQDHLYIMADKSDKGVRIHPTYAVAASIVALSVKPAAAVIQTNDTIGMEVSPRVNSGFADAGIVGVKSEPWRRGNDNCSGEIRGFEATLGTDSGYSGTVTGPVSVLKAVNNMHGTVTNGVYVLYATTHGGNKAWDGLANLPVDGEIAGATAPSTISGWIKVKIGANVRYIGVYTNPTGG